MRCIPFSELRVSPGCADTHVTRLRNGQIGALHTHDFFEVFLVLEGGGVHRLNGRNVPLSSGHLTVIRPEDEHGFSTEPGGNLVFVNVAVAAPWWRAFHTLLGLAPWTKDIQTVVLSPSDTRRLGSELTSAILGHDPAAVVRVWSRVREHFTSLVGQWSDTPPAWLTVLRRKLAENPGSLVEPISYWQKLAGRSPEHIARSCRKYYGMTFSELINQARVERVRFLLRTTDEKIITIAFDCGFQNLANFHRVFARLTGRTPGRWRREGTTAVPVSASAKATRKTEKLRAGRK